MSSFYNPSDILDQFESLLEQLEAILQAERHALASRDIEELERTSQVKLTLVEQLQAPQFGAALLEGIRNANPDQSTVLNARHKSAMERAIQVRDSNLVNGKILHRSQKSISDLLNILSGKPLDGLYGTSGRTEAAQQHGHATIAKA